MPRTVKKTKGRNGKSKPQSLYGEGTWVEYSLSGKKLAPINEIAAVNISAVYCAGTIISNAAKMMPIFLYEREGESGKTVARDHQGYKLLHDAPNPFTTPGRFKRQLIWWSLFWGDGCAEIERRRGDSSPLALWPIHPTRLKPLVQKDSSIIWRVTSDSGGFDYIPDADMFHIMGPSNDGIIGISVLDRARTCFGLTLNAEKHGSGFFGNNSTPGGVITHPGTLKPAGRENLRRSWEKAYRGPDSAGKTAILEEGMKFEAIGVDHQKSQFLEVRKFQVLEICRWFNIPPHKLKDLDREQHSNIEQQEIEFVQDTMMPWCVEIEEEADRKLLNDVERQTYFFECMVEGLLRADQKARFDSYAVARQWGWMNGNEIRAKENMNPIDGKAGTDYWAPVNMLPADKLGQQAIQQNKATPAGGASAKAPDANSEDDDSPDTNQPPIPRIKTAIEESYAGIFADVIRRMMKKEASAVNRAKIRPHFEKWVETFYADHALLVRSALIPACEACAKTFASLTGNEPSAEHVADLTKKFAEEHVRLASAEFRWADASQDSWTLPKTEGEFFAALFAQEFS